MKNIFIATDFSPASNNAAIYAIELAKKYHAKAYLFHAYQSRQDATLITNPAHPSHELKEWLIAEAELINKDEKVKLELFCEEGPATEMIIKNARKNNADVIVCAMKNNAKGFRKIFGSVASSLIKESNIPLIVVPEGVSFEKPKHIALGIDLDPKTSPLTLHILKDIAEHFSSKISVVYALQENYKEEEVIEFQPPANVSEISHLGPQYEFRTGNDITKILEDFSNTNSADMLAIIPHKHARLERWLTESVTKNMVFQAKRPVLILPQKITGVDDTKMNMEKLEKIWGNIKDDH